jgi:hypothetical protein
MPTPRDLSAVEVYWYDDTATGECRVPASWRALWLDGGTWRPIETTYEIAADRLNTADRPRPGRPQRGSPAAQRFGGDPAPGDQLSCRFLQSRAGLMTGGGWETTAGRRAGEAVVEQDDSAIELALLNALESGPRTENELVRAVGTNPWRLAELLDRMVEDTYVAVLPLEGEPRFELAPGGVGRLSLRRAMAKPGSRGIGKFIDAALAARADKRRAMRRQASVPRSGDGASDDALRMQILRMLAAGPRTREDLLRRTGVAEEQLGAVVEELARRGLIEGAYELTAAGRAHARWSTQLLQGGAVDGAARLHRAERSHVRKRRQEEAEKAERDQAEAERLAEALRRAADPPPPPRKDRWAAMREHQHLDAMMRQTELLQPAGRPPVLAGTFRWWVEVVVQGLLGCVALVAVVLLLVLEDHPDKVLHAVIVMVVGAALLVRATRAHQGVP